MTAFQNAHTAIIFGTDTGNTEEIANRIAKQFEALGVEADLHDVTDVGPEVFEPCDLLILGIPTWDFGGIQADWEDLESMLTALDLSGKTIALYGLGDQFGYGDYFVDAMGWLYNNLKASGAQFIGFWPTEGYEFDASLATLDDGKTFCGLAVDEDQQFDQTDQRIDGWVTQVVSEYNLLAEPA